MSKDQVPEEKIELFRRLVETIPEIEFKGGKKLPYTSINGHMFSQMTKAGTLGLRLGKEEREAFLETFQTTLLTNYGTVMKEYVAVPDALLNDTEQLSQYLQQSYAYAQTLKPKKSK